MKKKILIITSFILLLFCFLYFGWIYGWMTFNGNSDTPTQYVNKTTRNHVDYKIDQEKLLVQFSELLNKRVEFFSNSSYSDSTTQIIIDTIIYSPDFNRLGVLIIAKNPTFRQLVPTKHGKWFFDSTCYLAIRKNGLFELKMLGPTFTNEKSNKDASKDIRDACFRHFIVMASDIYKFNLDDRRFWQSKIWQFIFNNLCLTSLLPINPRPHKIPKKAFFLN